MVSSSSVLIAVEFAPGRYRRHDIVPVTDYGPTGKVLSRRVMEDGITHVQRFQAEKAASWLLAESAAVDVVLDCGLRVTKV